jgi:hypothetical protein
MDDYLGKIETIRKFIEFRWHLERVSMAVFSTETKQN